MDRFRKWRKGKSKNQVNSSPKQTSPSNTQKKPVKNKMLDILFGKLCDRKAQLVKTEEDKKTLKNKEKSGLLYKACNYIFPEKFIFSDDPTNQDVNNVLENMIRAETQQASLNSENHTERIEAEGRRIEAERIEAERIEAERIEDERRRIETERIEDERRRIETERIKEAEGRRIESIGRHQTNERVASKSSNRNTTSVKLPKSKKNKKNDNNDNKSRLTRQKLEAIRRLQNQGRIGRTQQTNKRRYEIELNDARKAQAQQVEETHREQTKKRLLFLQRKEEEQKKAMNAEQRERNAREKERREWEKRSV